MPFQYARRLLQFKIKFSVSTNTFSLFHSQSTLHLHTSSHLNSFVSSLVSSIASSTSISYCQALHCQVLKSIDYNHGFIGDQLVSAYLRLGRVKDSQKLFDELPHKDLVSWNSLISGFSRNGDLYNCLALLSRMRFEKGMVPNDVTVISLISACSYNGDFCVGRLVHGFAVKLDLCKEVKVVNALISFYGKHEHLNVARRVFEFAEMLNLVSWNSIIAIHVRMGSDEEGLRYFVRMRRVGIMADQATLVMLLRACENLCLRKVVEAIHGYVFSCGLDQNLTIATALLNAYAKLGVLSVSKKVFGEMNTRDSVAWTSMLAGYAMHGHGKEAIQLFESMVRDGVAPDHVTFTHLLSACSHAGLVKEGKEYFNFMSEVCGVEPRIDHFSCMVDLLGRSQHLDEAYKLIKSMPMEPNSGVWGALIAACRVYGNLELGKIAAEQLFALDASDSRNYIMLSNMYSAAGDWKNASKTRALMKDKSLARIPGYSYIEHGNKIHRFVMGDQSHSMKDQIYKKLEVLMKKVRQTGVASKTELVLHDVDQEVKEDLINKHSEKLAIAFGLLVTDDSLPLIIMKNLRICVDCHNTAKVISQIEKRTIIIRDTKRFHHFSEGICSCGDYW